MIPKLLPALVAGIVAFLVSSLAHQFSRGFDEGVLVSGGGSAVAVVGSGWGWMAGAAVFVIAVAAAILARRASRKSWLVFGVTVAALTVAGSVIRILVPAGDAPPPLLVTWLVDGAAEPLTWALAAVALAVGGRVAKPRAPRIETTPR